MILSRKSLALSAAGLTALAALIAVPLLGGHLAPAFGVNVADFDGDGNEDIFLSQNFFAVQPQASRHDAGRGLLLRGDGQGAFERIDGAQSGIKVYGEQRGSAAGDYDGDGRVDLAVTQNGAATLSPVFT